MARTGSVLSLVIALSLLPLTATGEANAKLKDAESAAHGYDAALCQPENTYDFPGYGSKAPL